MLFHELTFSQMWELIEHYLKKQIECITNNHWIFSHVPYCIFKANTQICLVHAKVTHNLKTINKKQEKMAKKYLETKILLTEVICISGKNT